MDHDTKYYMEKQVTKIITKEIKSKLTKKLKTALYSDAAALGAAGAAFVLALAAESESERNDPEYARYEINGSGKAGDNVRLLFLTDLHEKEFGKGNRVLLDMIDKADPDAVLIGGDMPVASKSRTLTGPIKTQDTAPGSMKTDAKTKVSLALCRELAKKYEVFYGNGNHEQRLEDKSYFYELREMGVTILDNRTLSWKYNISISGLELSSDQYRPVSPQAPDADFIRERIGTLDSNRFNILLAHSPLFIESYAAAGADLVFSGHFHGGTIRLPGDVGLMTPQYQLFNTNVVGMKQSGTTKMVISSGLGTHSVNIRINNKPQVVVVDIKK